MRKLQFFTVFILFFCFLAAEGNTQDSLNSSENTGQENIISGVKQEGFIIDENLDTLYTAGSVYREYIPLLAIMAYPDYEEVSESNSLGLKLSFLNSGLRFNLYDLYKWFMKFYLLNWISSELDNPLISMLMDFAFLYLIPDLLGFTGFDFGFFNSTVPNYFYTGNHFTTVTTPNYKPYLSTPMPRTGLHHETYTKSDSLLNPVRTSDPVPVSENGFKDRKPDDRKPTVKKKDTDDGPSIFDIIFGGSDDNKNDTGNKPKDDNSSNTGYKPKDGNNNNTGNKPNTETGNRPNTETKPKTETGNKPNTEIKPKVETPKTQAPKTETPKTESNTGKKQDNNSTEKSGESR